MIDVLAAEFLKLRTTRIIWMLLAATLALTALAVAGAVLVASDNANLDLESGRGVRTVLHVSASGAILVLILGIVMSAGEYRQGTATDTFLTTPGRWRVIAAKLIVATTTGVGFGGLSAVVAMAIANHLYALKGYTFPLDTSDVWVTIAGSVLYAALFGAIGAATGSLVRNQVGAIVAWLAWLFVAEQILFELAPTIGQWLPAAAGRALVRDPDADLLAQPIAAITLALYAAVIMLIAILSERHRDA